MRRAVCCPRAENHHHRTYRPCYGLRYSYSIPSGRTPVGVLLFIMVSQVPYIGPNSGVLACIQGTLPPFPISFSSVSTVSQSQCNKRTTLQARNVEKRGPLPRHGYYFHFPMKRCHLFSSPKGTARYNTVEEQGDGEGGETTKQKNAHQN